MVAASLAAPDSINSNSTPDREINVHVQLLDKVLQLLGEPQNSPLGVPGSQRMGLLGNLAGER